MTAKNATRRGPLGACARTASSSRRAWVSLMTERRSISLVVFGAFHLMALTGLRGSRPHLAAYSSALYKMARLRRTVDADAMRPSSSAAAAPSTARVTAGSARAATGLVLRDNHLRI